MAKLILKPTEIQACGNKMKIIKEYVGHVNSSTNSVSIARMDSPRGWEEPGQRPEFDEYTLVLKGILCAQTSDEIFEIKEGQAFIAEKNEWIKYSTPYEDGAEYVAICLPAFSPNIVHRDNDKK